jgi:tripartite-type tricarboxylate transporter receptor subunit TctC
MLRGIFMAPEVSAEQQQFFIDLLQKVRETPDWKEFMERGAFNTTTMNGAAFKDWLGKEEARHMMLMKSAGFLAGRGK